MLRHPAFSLVLVLVFSFLAMAEEESKKEPSLKDVKCLFCQKNADKANAAEYKNAKVFFGCAGCVEAFKREPKKYATQANAQLVATKQAKQIACPLSGKKSSDKFQVAVNKTKVALCCPSCKKAMDKLDDEAKLKKLFSDAAFKKGFAVPKPKKKG